MLRSRRESHHSNGITEHDCLQLTSATKPAKSGHQFGLELEDASTLYAAIGRRMPFSANSPTASTITAFSIACRTRGLMRICPGFASSQSRDATFETVPIAA